MHTTGLKLVKTETLDLGVILLCYQPAKKRQTSLLKFDCGEDWCYIDRELP